MFSKQIKAVKHIQDMAEDTQNAHDEIERGIERLKQELMSLDAFDEQEYQSELEHERSIKPEAVPLERKTFTEISRESERSITRRVTINDILTHDDMQELNSRINRHIHEFNREYSLDAWDYAIAGTCGLAAGMLDWLCIKSPVRSTSMKFNTQLDGIFNRTVQEGFNKILPPDLSHNLSESFKIGSADTSMKGRLLSYSGKLSPYNHRLKELSHDPVLGLIFGVHDMMNNSCTIIENGKIRVYKSMQTNNFNENIFYSLGRMLGHLASDINAPSASGNRGMGLPAPFMGLLSMLNGVNINGESIGSNIEYMYLNGYDMRQFVVSSVPVSIMEILLRACWVIKGMKLEGKTFWEALSQTSPGNMHKKFRVITAASYGVLCAVNAGKVSVTKNILDVNYSAWIGLIWNGFHALKWALLDKNFLLWETLEREELIRLEDTIKSLEELEHDAEFLPV
ncbi:MAG: hypothetical protein IJP48_08800 [Synergistaceae bacterium]|nr:hypothetical protein [Synergistaceae bacterium]